jgi:membrane-bound inhibitor of C-type lysozyme
MLNLLQRGTNRRGDRRRHRLAVRMALVSAASATMLAASPVLAGESALGAAGAAAQVPAQVTAQVSGQVSGQASGQISAQASAPVPAQVPVPPVDSPASAPLKRQFALTFPSIKVVSRSIVSYRCADGRDMGVAYMNTDNHQSFAVIRIDGQHLVFVDTLAGSGVRYAAGRYVWWSKGDEGNLYDTMAGDNAPPVAKDCKAIKQ